MHYVCPNKVCKEKLEMQSGIDVFGIKNTKFRTCKCEKTKLSILNIEFKSSL